MSCNLCCGGAGNANFNVVAGGYSGADSYYSGATRRYYFKFADPSTVLGATGAIDTSGLGVKTVNDEAGGALSCLQATALNQPTCNTNALGSFQSVKWISALSQSMALSGTGNTAVIKNTGTVSMGFIFNPTSIAGGSVLFRIFDNSFSFNRFLCEANTSGFSITVVPNDTGTGVQTLTTAASIISAGTWYTVLFEWNAAAGTGAIYLNGVSKSLTGSWPAAANVANTTGNQPQVGLSSCDVQMLETFLYTGALMGSANASSWSTAARAYYGF